MAFKDPALLDAAAGRGSELDQFLPVDGKRLKYRRMVKNNDETTLGNSRRPGGRMHR